MALDINLQEMDLPRGVPLANLSESRRLYDGRAQRLAGVRMTLRKLLYHCAKLLAHNIVKHHLPGRVRSNGLDVDVPSPSRGQSCEPFGRRFDIDPVPALLVEQLCDRILFRIIGSNIDVESGVGGDVLRPVETQKIFACLSPADNLHHRPPNDAFASSTST